MENMQVNENKTLINILLPISFLLMLCRTVYSSPPHQR